MKRTITIHQSAPPILSGPQRPLSLPAIGLRALDPRPMTFHDKDAGGIAGAVAKAMAGETDVAKKAEKGLLTIAEQLDHMTADHTQLDKDTKKLLEDFTAAKNNFDGLGSSVKSLEQAMQKFSLRLNQDRAAAFGDPLKRIENDEQQRTLMNAMVRANFVPKGLRLHEKHEKILKEAGFEVVDGKWLDPRELRQKATISGGSTPGSAYFMTELDRNVYSVLPQYGIWGTLDVQPMGALAQQMPVLTADPVCNVIAEGGTITPDSSIAGTSVTATAKKLCTIVTLTSEILEDSEIDVTAQTMEQVGNATAYRADYMSFIADGTNDATNGAATGILHFGTTVAVPSGATTVEGMDYTDVNAACLGIDVGAFQQSPRWWMHRFILFRFLNIKDNNGRPIFLTAMEAPAAGGIGSIMGFPVTLGNVMPSTNSTGQQIAIFGSPRAFRVGLRRQLTWLTSDIPYFTTDLIATRAIARMAFKGKKATALANLTLA